MNWGRFPWILLLIAATFSCRSLRSDNDYQPETLEYYQSKLKSENDFLRERLIKSEAEKMALERALVNEALSHKTSTSPFIRPPSVEVDTQTYITHKGDTLQSISQLFYGQPKYWVDIYQVNREKVSKGGFVRKGTVLLIPPLNVLEEEPEPEPLPPPPPPPPKPEPKKPPKKEEPVRPKTYTVQPGDTLKTIAEKIYNDPKKWKDIYKANADKVERGSVAPGAVLALP